MGRKERASLSDLCFPLFCFCGVWGSVESGREAGPMLGNLQVRYMHFWYLANPTALFLLKPGDQGFHAVACSVCRKYSEPLTFSAYIQPPVSCYGAQTAYQLLAKLCDINIGQSFCCVAKNNILRTLCVCKKPMHENGE